MRKFKVLVAGAALLAISGGAHAFLIDDFDGGDAFISVTSFPTLPASVNQPYANALGGSRTLLIAAATGAGNGPSLSVSGGLLLIGNPPNAGSTGAVVWDNNGNGLGGIDLTEGGLDDAIELEITEIDVGSITLQFFVEDTFANKATLTFRDLVVGRQAFLFTDFVQNSANTNDVDFTAIDDAQLRYATGSNVDVTLDLILTRQGVPIPGTVALLGIGLVGLGLRRRALKAEA